MDNFPIHRTINFHCSYESIVRKASFLNLTLSILNNFLIHITTDLFRVQNRYYYFRHKLETEFSCKKSLFIPSYHAIFFYRTIEFKLAYYSKHNRHPITLSNS